MTKPPKSKKKRKPIPKKIPVTKLAPHQIPKPGISLVQEKLIGRVIVAWSHTEQAMHDLTWRMLKLDFEDGRILTKRMDANLLIQILRALGARHLTGDHLDTLKDLLNEADALRDDRNFIGHGTWGTLMPNADAIALSLRAKAEPNELISETFPYDRMRQIARDLIRVKMELMRLMDELYPLP